MNFTGKGQPLSQNGLDAALGNLGLTAEDAACLWAVIHVETSGFGFLPDRRPQILFERHKFSAFTDHRFDGTAPAISAVTAGGYDQPSNDQYARLQMALDLCEEVGLGPEPALKSASWGIGQVMGSNFAAAGFTSATEMVKAMIDKEDTQLAAMAGFIHSNNLAGVLQQKQWAKFAKGYNGVNFQENQYDTKLAENFQRLSSGSMPSLDVRTAQAALFYLGNNPGKPDGILGPHTRQAIRNFRAAEGLPSGDALDDATLAALCRKVGFDA